ncbi:hypothetical protein ACROYT_G033415 [Oculina patagonica]
MNKDWTNEQGSRTSKAPTCLLLTPDLTFNSFGYDAMEHYAELQSEQEEQEYYFFQHFKMALHSDTTLNLETSLKAANGKHVKAKTVFAHSIKFMKDEAIKLISLETGDKHFKAEDIQWVLTVPAIWTPGAKQFMREAAYEVRYMAFIKTSSAANKARQFDEFVEQQIERMPQMTDPLREVVRNILDEPISLEVQKRLLKPMLSQEYHPKPPKRLRREEKKKQKRKNIQNEFDPFLPHENRVVTNYQNEILNLLDTAEYDGEEENGRRFIRWRFIRGLEKDLTPNFIENIRGKVNTAFYIRHVYSYQLRNIDNYTVIVYYINHGSSWINKLPAAEKWLSEQETKRLASDNIQRPSTKWEFVSFFNVDVKVVRDRQPLLGTGPLPDWFRNLARGRPMVALDTYLDNLCLWRCIAVHQGARIDRSTAAARGLAKSFF